VHDQLAVDEVEAVGARVERLGHHLADHLRVQFRKIVNLKKKNQL
jgi:hypothetical protein